MNEPTEKPMLACAPVSDPNVKVTPVKGSAKGVCDECGSEVWLGPNQIAFIKNHPDAIKHCFRCIAKKAQDDPDMLDNLELIPLGVGGHTYELSDGEKIEPYNKPAAGKYAEECDQIMNSTGATTTILMVLGGPKGAGFSVSTKDKNVLKAIPGILRWMADEIEQEQQKRRE